MKKHTAIAEAQCIANNQGTEMTVYLDPIGLGEQEGHEHPWGYCPNSSIEIAAKFRQKDEDFSVSKIELDTTELEEYYPKDKYTLVHIQDPAAARSLYNSKQATTWGAGIIGTTGFFKLSQTGGSGKAKTPILFCDQNLVIESPEKLVRKCDKCNTIYPKRLDGNDRLCGESECVRADGFYKPKGSKMGTNGKVGTYHKHKDGTFTLA